MKYAPFRGSQADVSRHSLQVYCQHCLIFGLPSIQAEMSRDLEAALHSSNSNKEIAPFMGLIVLKEILHVDGQGG